MPFSLYFKASLILFDKNSFRLFFLQKFLSEISILILMFFL